MKINKNRKEIKKLKKTIISILKQNKVIRAGIFGSFVSILKEIK